jgi:murein DD-endopeptidase MepM/ murein hydrolase activator NlpD
LSFRGRRHLPRAWLLATLATLALAAVGPLPALAGAPLSVHGLAPSFLRPDPLPEPRVQEPGRTSGFRLPFAAGQEIRVYQGWNTTFSHNGKAAFAYDFGLVLGIDVLAAAGGVVAFVHDGETACGGPALRNKANYVTIYHADGSATQYGHLSSVDVKVGEVVTAGQLIGKSGDTGYSGCMPHLHFARQYQGRGVAQSVPVYFQGYADQEFHSGDVVAAPADTRCSAPSTDGLAGDEPEVGSFCGEYSGGAVDYPVSFERRDPLLNFDWGSQGPGGYWLDDSSVGFSAHWSGRFAFSATALYTVAVMWSGSVTVSIDGQPVADRWLAEGRPLQIVLSRAISAGIHRIDIDYATANGHGMLKLGWGRFFADA